MEQCPEGQMMCGGACVDVQTDPTHCGGCATACWLGQSCEAGRCVTPCSGDNMLLCGELCVDITSDNANCGACGHVCEEGRVCTGGVCEPYCLPPQTLCDGRCLDLQTDRSHCGSCTAACTDKQYCAGGRCLCNPGWYDPNHDGNCQPLPSCIVFASVDGTGDGSSWALAQGNLQTAVDMAGVRAAARPDGTCYVFAQEGAYLVHQASAQDTLALRTGVILAGGFAGSESTLAERALDPTTGLPVKESRIDGEGQVSHVISASGTSRSVLDGLVITGGNIAGGTVGDDGYGAGLTAANVSGLVVRKCVFRDLAAANGGGIAIKGGDLQVDGSHFLRNVAAHDGGALDARASASLVVSNSLFDANSAKQGVGGAIFSADTAALTITGSTFLLNLARREGGAVWHIGSGTVVIAESAFIHNNTKPADPNEGGGDPLPDDADARAFLGGALFVRAVEQRDIDNGFATTIAVVKSVQLGRVAFTGNQAVREGGAVYMKGVGAVTLSGVTMLGNACQPGSSPTGEGGIGGGWAGYNIGSVVILDSTFTSNSAYYDGGGVLLRAADATGGPLGSEGIGSLRVERSTFINNHSHHGHGGGLMVRGKLASTTLALTHSIFSGNEGVGGGGGGLAAIDLASAQLIMTRFFGNGAEGGAGIYAASVGSIELYDVTFDDNSSAVGGSGMVAKDYNSLGIHGGSFAGSLLNVLTNGSGLVACSRPLSDEARRAMPGGPVCNNLFADLGSAPAGRAGITLIEGTSFTSNQGVVVRSEELASFTLRNAQFTNNSDPSLLGEVLCDGVVATTISDTQFANNQTLYLVNHLFVRQKTGLTGGALNVARLTFGDQLRSVSSTGTALIVDNINQVTIDQIAVDGYVGSLNGAGFWVRGASQVTVTDSQFTNNVMLQSGADARSGAGVVDGHGLEGQVGNPQVTFRNCTFRGNKANVMGGALAVYYAQSLTLDNCQFIDNGSVSATALKVGGAVYLDTVAALGITDSTFRGNDAPNANGSGNGTGGAVMGLRVGDVTVSDSLFDRNRAAVRGGAFHVESSPTHTVTISDTQFTDNASGNTGGALAVQGADRLTIRDCRFLDNAAGAVANDYHDACGGALLVQETDEIVIERTAFLNNTVGTLESKNYNGGAMAIDGTAVLNVSDSLFGANAVYTRGADCTPGGGPNLCGWPRGGAILMKPRYKASGPAAITVSINGSTFAGNVNMFGATVRNEGAISIMPQKVLSYPDVDAADISLTISNSIVWNNWGEKGLVVNPNLGYAPLGNGVIFANSSDLQDGDSGYKTGSDAFNKSLDPLFQGASIGDRYATYRLRFDSPCKGTGRHDLANATDLFGNPRANPPSMGAIE